VPFGTPLTVWFVAFTGPEPANGPVRWRGGWFRRGGGLAKEGSSVNENRKGLHRKICRTLGALQVVEAGALAWRWRGMIVHWRPILADSLE
jgi:hypothetical protein